MQRPGYNYFKEKRVLVEEEKTLLKMVDKFQDQLNRLKIEELALMSMIKMQETADASNNAASGSQHRSAQSMNSGMSEVSSLGSSVVPVGVMEQRAPGEDEDNILELEEVNLQINNFLDHTGQMGGFEMEEEEEEEEDEDEDRDVNKELSHFMDMV